MHSIEIPKEINIKIYKLKDTEESIEKYCIVLWNKRSRIWFTIDNSNKNISLKYNTSFTELMTSSKRLKNLTLKGMDRITLGYKETLKLLGVGFRGEVKTNKLDSNVLCLRVGKPEIESFDIPKDVTVNIENDIIEFWSYSDKKVNILIDKILRKLPIRKGSIIKGSKI